MSRTDQTIMKKKRQQQQKGGGGMKRTPKKSTRKRAERQGSEFYQTTDAVFASRLTRLDAKDLSRQRWRECKERTITPTDQSRYDPQRRRRYPRRPKHIRSYQKHHNTEQHRDFTNGVSSPAWRWRQIWIHQGRAGRRRGWRGWNLVGRKVIGEEPSDETRQRVGEGDDLHMRLTDMKR